jgi:hypothetical protein
VESWTVTLNMDSATTSLAPPTSIATRRHRVLELTASKTALTAKAAKAAGRPFRWPSADGPAAEECSAYRPMP